MVKSKDLVLLRQYICSGDEVAFEDLKALFTEGIKEAEIEATISDEDIAVGGLLSSKIIPACMIMGPTEHRYIAMYIYTYVDKRTPIIEIAATGKGEQIKASELGSMFVKKSVKMKSYIGGLANAYKKAKSYGSRFSSPGASIGAAVGVGASSLVVGGFKLAATGIKLAMRDKEAYEKELTFYTSVLALGDYLLLEDNE